MASFELVSFLHPDNPPGISLPPHAVVNDDLHLIHTVSGSATARIGKNVYRMTPGSVIFIEPYVEYAITLDPARRLEMLNFHFHLFADMGVPITRVHGLPTTFRPRNLVRIQRHLRRWHRLWTGPSVLKRAEVAARLHELVIAYLRAFPAAPATPVDPLAEHLAALLREKARVEFDAEACAAAVFISVSQMNRRFRLAYGTSPKDFWLRHRYLLARSRLQYSAQTISAIAQELGFGDPNYFSRWFKTMSGSAPLEFRKRAARVEI